MITGKFKEEPDLCEVCCTTKLSKLAYDIDPSFYNEKGLWIGGFTQENAEKARAAYAEATKRLAKPCIKLYLEDEFGVICKDCLQNILNLFEKGGTQNG